MTIDEIKELIHVLQETGIAELEVQRGDNRVRIRKASAAPQDVIVPAVQDVKTTDSAHRLDTVSIAAKKRRLISHLLRAELCRILLARIFFRSKPLSAAFMRSSSLSAKVAALKLLLRAR